MVWVSNFALNRHCSDLKGRLARQGFPAGKQIQHEHWSDRIERYKSLSLTVFHTFLGFFQGASSQGTPTATLSTPPTTRPGGSATLHY